MDNTIERHDVIWPYQVVNVSISSSQRDLPDPCVMVIDSPSSMREATPRESPSKSKANKQTNQNEIPTHKPRVGLSRAFRVYFIRVDFYLMATGVF